MMNGKKKPWIGETDWLKKHIAALVVLPGLLAGGTPHASEELDRILDLPLEDLLSLEVSSVSRKLEKLRNAAAAVHVLTGDDIRRMGATSIPEALRMVPGVQVGKINSNQDVVGVRGFGGRYSDKLLVLIDGRSVYIPSYAGVYWDEHDIPLENIERIEVIRGPGATLWGANAVNGIINIITYNAHDLEGGVLVAGAGSYERHRLMARQQVTLAPGVDAYVHAKRTARDELKLSTGGDANDDWVTQRAGFRVDASGETDWGVQGDVYRNDGNQLVITNVPPQDEITSKGWFLSGYWQKDLSDSQSLRLKSYYDHQDRKEGFLGQRHDTFDLDFQHDIELNQTHSLVWGLGYRHVSDDFSNTPQIAFNPSSRTTNLYSAFVQDEISLVPDTFKLILGSKFEHNDFTGFEIQPNLRAVWTPDEEHTLWGSLSRAVHVPSRVDVDAQITVTPVPPVRVLGNASLESEELLAWELGYRWFPESSFSVDAALFYNDYENLISGIRDPLNPLNIVFQNAHEGQSWGGELALAWQATEDWRLKANYGFVRIDTGDDFLDRGTPQQQLAVHSMWDIDAAWTLDAWAQYVDEVERASESAPAGRVDAYTTFNARLAWKPKPGLTLSLIGKNLLDEEQLQAVGELITPETRVSRSVFAEARLEW